MKRMLVLFVFFSAVVLSTGTWAIGDSGDDDNYNPDARPGKDNPVTPNRQSLFRDDELWLMIGHPKDSTADFKALTPDNADLNHWSAEEHTHDYLTSEYALVNGNAPPWSSDRGRITDPKHDQIAYAFYRPDGDIEVELWDYPDRQAGYVKLDGTTTTPQSVDVAVGDVDALAGDDDYYHDEVVVARIADDKYKGHVVKVDVLNYNLDTLDSVSVPADNAPQSAAVAVGDFDGDGNLDIVVAQSAGNGSDLLQLDILSPKLDSDGNVIQPLELENVSSTQWRSRGQYVDVAAGDFIGSGRYAIAVVFGGPEDTDGVLLWLWEVSKDFHLTDRSGYTISYGGHSPSIAAGFFYFDPKHGYLMSRRQLVIAYAMYFELVVQAHRVTTSGYDWWSLETDPGMWSDYISCDKISNIRVSTGNFIGHQKQSGNPPPIEQIVVSYTEVHGSKSKPALRIFGHPNSTNEQKLDNYFSWSGDLADAPVPTLVSATDNDGDTYRLGTPAHIVFDSLISLDYVLQEPPKHVDYLPVDPDDPEGDWEMVNISAWSDFVVELEDEQEQTVETETENTSSMDIGKSETTDMGASFSVGFGDIFGAEVDTDVKNKVSTDYKSEESHYNSHYGSRSVSYSNQTNIDDNLHAKMHTIDVWRYPIYGVMTDDDKHGVQEIALPGPEVIIAGGGKDHGDWYQPPHQNRNILSYPHFIAEKTSYSPDDLGSFYLPDGTEVHDIMNEGATYYWNGNEQTIRVAWTEEAGGGSTKSYNHTLSKSKDVSAGIKAKASYFHMGIKAHASVDVSFDESCSWGGNTTATASNSKSKGVTIMIPEQTGEEFGYAFQSAIYISSGGGAFKVAHATDPLGGQGSDWWTQYYGGKPDPALNLPNRFEHHSKDATHRLEYWTLNEDYTRKRMRGFVMYSSKKNPVTGKNDIISASPTDGDVVKLCAKVYNYSLFHDTGDFKVSFYGVVFDTENAKEVGDLFSIAETTTSLDSIAKTQDEGYTYEGQEPMKEVCVDWDTTGFSDRVVDGKHYSTYRLYVILDEDDEVKDEIHEWKDADGNKLAHGNNEGYWPWKNAIQIVPKNSGKADDYLTGTDVFLHAESLAIAAKSGLTSDDGIIVDAGKTHDLRLHIKANKGHPHYRYAIFYEGDPENGGRVVSTQRVFGVSADSTHVWTEWTPPDVGEYDLWARITEDADDPNWDNATDTLHVIVRPPAAGHEKVGCGCAIDANSSGGGTGHILVFVLIMAGSVALTRRLSNKS